MRLKQIGIFFSATLTLLIVLLAIRADLPEKALREIKKIHDLRPGEKDTLPVAASARELPIETVLLERLDKLETPRAQVTVHHDLEKSALEINAAVPRGKPMEWIILSLCSRIGDEGYRISDCSCADASKCVIELQSARKGRPAVRLTLTRSRRFFSTSAKMAVVIMDFGFKADATSVDFLSFPEPLTLSIVATKKMSSWTAQIANEYRKEIILLIPMEPLFPSYRHYASEAVFVHYPSEKIRSIVRGATESIPYYAGFSNLCGSRVIEDTPVMRTILGELKKGHGYFLINQSSRKSVAASVARSLEVPYRSVEISLDSAASTGGALGDTLRHAAMIAHKTGSVVVQGRATPQLIGTLRAQLPFLQQNGIRLVYLSEVVRHPGE